LGQSLALLNGTETYTKSSLTSQYPLLADVLMRKSSNGLSEVQRLFSAKFAEHLRFYQSGDLVLIKSAALFSLCCFRKNSTRLIGATSATKEAKFMRWGLNNCIALEPVVNFKPRIAKLGLDPYVSGIIFYREDGSILVEKKM